MLHNIMHIYILKKINREFAMSGYLIIIISFQISNIFQTPNNCFESETCIQVASFYIQ